MSDDVLKEALELVINLAEGNCLDQEFDPDDLTEDEDLAAEGRRQRTAINHVKQHLESMQ